MKIGPYEVIRKLGQGGMASVFLALHVQGGEKGGEKVALKVLFHAGEKGEGLWRRFRHEFQACARIEHPNVIRVKDFGRDGDKLYYTMEYLPHPTLRSLLTRSRKLPLPRSLEIAASLCRALDCIHGHDLVHRDLKPSNVIVTDDERVVLMDFGLAKHPEWTRVTETFDLVGTPCYLTPEQLRGDPAVPASDIFTLGLVLFEMVSGRRALAGKTSAEVAAACLAGTAELAVGELAEATDHLKTVLRRCLASDTDQRYPSAKRLEEDLLRLLHDEAPAPWPSPSSRARKAPTSPPPALSSRRQRPWHLAALALAVFGGAHAILRRPATTPRPVEDIRLERGFTRARVTWRGKGEGHGRIQLAGPTKTTLFAGRPTGEGHREVLLEGLRSGRRYRYTIIHPGGRRSLERTLTIPKFRTSLQEAFLSKDQLILNFKTPMPLRCTLETQLAGGGVLRSPPTPMEVSHRAAVTVASPVTKATLICADPFGESRKVDLMKPLGVILHRWARPINFNPTLLANEVNLSGYTMARRHEKDLGIIRSIYPKAEDRINYRRKGGKQLDTALRVLGISDAAKALRPYTGLLLDSWLLDHRERASLYATLMRLTRLRHAAHRHRAIYKASLTADLGQQTPRYTSLLKDARLVRRTFMPFIRLETIRPFPKKPRRHRCILDLGLAKAALRAEIGLTVADLPPFFTLRCSVGRSEVHLYSPADRQESCQIWASFDPRGIKDGKNPVSITFLAPVGTGLRRGMDLKDIRIRLHP